MGRELGVLQDIIDAPPTDGLWDDGRTDSDQLGGLTYAELEMAMRQDNNELPIDNLEQLKNVEKYRQIRARSLHKMNPIPVYKKSSVAINHDKLHTRQLKGSSWQKLDL